MDRNLEELKLEDILKNPGDVKHDNAKLSNQEQAFNVREFIFIYYGHSKDKKSRLVAEYLNEYVGLHNPEEHNSGLRR